MHCQEYDFTHVALFTKLLGYLDPAVLSHRNVENYEIWPQLLHFRTNTISVVYLTDDLVLGLEHGTNAIQDRRVIIHDQNAHVCQLRTSLHYGVSNCRHWRMLRHRVVMLVTKTQATFFASYDTVLISCLPTVNIDGIAEYCRTY